MFLNRESLDQVSNSKAPFVFVLDSLMAEQQPGNKSTLEETKVPPANEADEAYPKLVAQFHLLRRQPLLS